MLLKFSNEIEWLAQKAKDITSTELAALFGLSDYKSRLKLWAIKKGILEDDFEENNLTKWGKRLQNSIAIGICEDNGWECEDLTGLYYHDPVNNSGSSLDTISICPNEGRSILEIKNVGVFDPDAGWTLKQAPIDIEFQIQGQLHQAIGKHGEDIRFGRIGALGGRQEVRLFPREYDKDLGALIDEECFSFWRSIERDQQPEPDYCVDSEVLAKLRKPIMAGEGCNLTHIPKAVELITEWYDADQKMAALRPEINRLKAIKDKCKTGIYDLMGRAEFANIGTFRVKAPVHTKEDKVIYESQTRRFDVSRQKGR